jgi:ABC-type tungstate transport system substrate-binding protein
MSSKNLNIFIGSLICLIYFLFVNTIQWKLDSKFLNLFQELLTIPFLIISLVLFALSINQCLNTKFTLKNIPFGLF